MCCDPYSAGCQQPVDTVFLMKTTSYGKRTELTAGFCDDCKWEHADWAPEAGGDLLEFPGETVYSRDGPFCAACGYPLFFNGCVLERCRNCGWIISDE